ncbi:ABC transporter ATP-binding protein [Paenibacillus gorillae]|uniref:ABC transporter ATP-binding protein n=1 Tax=Paenibacillus gorillae TaxID=1243662 RepID=UPI0004B2DF56|nr:ABC transporter ATP-binding protein [Paenibacillus gorillae]
MLQTAAIEVRNVTKSIAGKTIVKDLSFTVQAGEIYGFLGPNGAGKTTTIRMMVGLISIGKGDIRIGGSSIRTARGKALEQIGAIVENPELYKEMSGRQNLKHYANMSSKPVSNKRIEEVVRLVQLGEAIDRKVKTYSLGMRQRLGIAQAILHRPSILILDEPTNGLDPAGIRELRQYLQQLAKTEGMAVIVSSHLIAEIELLCDRVIIIQKGQLVAERSLKEIDGDGKVTVDLEVTDPERAAMLLKPSVVYSNSGSNIMSVRVMKEEIPGLVSDLVQHGIGIVQVTIRTAKLEELFLELTQGGRS